jgi:hypothetical protein
MSLKSGGKTDRVIRAAVLVTLTIVGVEWIHFRLGEPTIWDFIRANHASPNISISGRTGPSIVTEADFELYIEVLESLQENHALTVENVVDSTAITLPRFRAIEARVQRNPLLVQRTRKLLRKNAEDLWESRSSFQQG